MSLTAREQTLPDECLAEEQLDVLLCPLLGRQGLQKNHHLLEVHTLQLVRPFDEEGGADVKMEGGEALLFGLRCDCQSPKRPNGKKKRKG